MTFENLKQSYLILSYESSSLGTYYVFADVEAGLVVVLVEDGDGDAHLAHAVAAVLGANHQLVARRQLEVQLFVHAQVQDHVVLA